MNQTHHYHNLIDIVNKEIFPACVIVEQNRIKSVTRTDKPCQHYILPGFIDAHVHIESSMLIPSEFARMAVAHGTVATVSDPHEIANVCGIEGVEFMLNNASKVPFKFFFGAPSCVPATTFETAGAQIDAEGIGTLLMRNDVYYLSEMMNYPGVLHEDPEVMKKIAIAKSLGKPVDGHAPGLRGAEAAKYAGAGISTDHECFTYEEAKEKLELGMKILIREGSAAKNFDALIPLLPDYENELMFCCDDKHPDELILHHISRHVIRSLQKGYNLFQVLQAACINPILHYKLDVGMLQQGDKADFIIVDSIENFNVLQTVINGRSVFEHTLCKIESVSEYPINKFACDRKVVSDFKIEAAVADIKIRVIEALEGQLITNTVYVKPKIENGNLISNVEEDVLKITVVNRYQNTPPAVAFIKNFGLKTGAIASTVAHDSHNIICVGTSDEEITRAVNILIDCKGGICVVGPRGHHVLPLPVGGLMSTEKAEIVAQKYSQLDQEAKKLGCTLAAPFMTLSFMALLVIPQLKLSDKGLFDGERFEMTTLTV